jgi:hypothetical protein
MTRSHPSTVQAPRDASCGATRTQFLFARKQAAAHASTGRIREMFGWTLVAPREQPPASG